MSHLVLGRFSLPLLLTVSIFLYVRVNEIYWSVYRKWLFVFVVDHFRFSMLCWLVSAQQRHSNSNKFFIAVTRDDHLFTYRSLFNFSTSSSPLTPAHTSTLVPVVDVSTHRINLKNLFFSFLFSNLFQMVVHLDAAQHTWTKQSSNRNGRRVGIEKYIFIHYVIAHARKPKHSQRQREYSSNNTETNSFWLDNWS